MRLKVLALLLSVTVLACNNIREKLLPSFNFNIPDINLSIPPIPVVQPKEMPVGALKANINMDSAIRANTAGAFGAGAVSTVKVKKITFLILNADELNNLSNFESGRMRIYSDNDTAATDIATIIFPANNTDSLTYIPTETKDISNYLRGKQISYNIFWKNRKVTNKRLKLQIKVTLAIQ